jgi:hypothetical protein
MMIISSNGILILVLGKCEVAGQEGIQHMIQAAGYCCFGITCNPTRNASNRLMVTDSLKGNSFGRQR